MKRLLLVPLALLAAACSSSATGPTHDIGVNRVFANVTGVT